MAVDALRLPRIVVCSCLALTCSAVLAQEGPTATPVEQIHLLPDFRAELLYSVPGDEQGSWVSMTADAQGRLIVSDQYGKLYRVTVPPLDELGDIHVEAIDVELGMAQGLLYAFDSLYVMVNGKVRGQRGDAFESGLYRVRDTDGDDQFDSVELLRRLEGGGEHGPHAIVLSPDGNSLFVCAGNHTDPPEFEASRVPLVWDEDILHDRMWDAKGHARGKLAPGGWIAKVSPDGSRWELFSNGFRNEYDIAFNTDGELFTFDADMEWDIGAPWYRPTRVNHVTSGSEFGWRSGTGKWPDYYPDSLGSVIDIGPGSPTGIVFGTGARFPHKYQRALYIADWSYGIIYAVHLEPRGGSYVGTAERFASAQPLPVTDMLVHPHDGSLYFAIGGRKTQSGLYRVTYTGHEPTDAAPRTHDDGAHTRGVRFMLEGLHGVQHPAVVDAAWPFLAHQDRHIRFAARVAIEHQPVDQWDERVFEQNEPDVVIQSAIALARHGDPSHHETLIQRLSTLNWETLSLRQQLDLVRAYGLVLLRLGDGSPESREAVIAQLNRHFPSSSMPLNRELSTLLIRLQAPGIVGRTLDLLAGAPTQEDQIHFALVLKDLKSGWTLDERSAYFAWFNQAAAHRGGMSFSGFLENIRDESIETLTDAERTSLASVLESKPQPLDPATTLQPRDFVRKWTVEELVRPVEEGQQGRSFDKGRELFAAAACFRCHRVRGEGGSNGPDLTGAGGRFNVRNLLESLIEPSKVISDQYQKTMFLLSDGRVIDGRVINLNGDKLMVLTDMLDPSKLESIERRQIEQSQPSETSMMPAGLLDTLSQDEILDLVAFLRSGGDPGHPAYEPATSGGE